MNIKIGKASFKDSSLNNFPITANGNAQTSKAQSKFGGWAGYFTAGAGANPIGTKSWLTTPSPLLNGIGAYTVEAWVYLNPPDYYRTVYSTRVVNTGSSFGFTDLNELFAYSDATGGLSSGAVVPHSQWVHVAWTYDGTNFRMFIDGVKVYDETEQLSHGTGSYIGRASIFPEPDYGEFFIGYMDDFRITNGIALYTFNFTPPISELTASSQTSLLLNMNAGSVIASKGGSGKTNQKKYIDLLPPNFISKVTLSGGDYSNGTYTRNSGGTTTFNGPDGKTIFWSGILWLSLDPLYNSGEDATYYSYDLITWIEQDIPNPPTAVVENALSFLFDPIFYKNEIQNERYKISVQGCTLSYVNGIYSQTVDPSLVNNRPYFVKDDDSSMVINYEGGNWYIRDFAEREYGQDLFYKIDACNTSPCRPDYLDWSTVDGGNAYDDGQTPPTITQHLNLMVQGGADLDPAFLETLRTYQQANIIPNLTSALTRQYIKGSSFNSRKVVLANNALKYIKNNDNSDVPYLKKYGRIITNTAADMNDNKKSLLICKKNDDSVIFNGNGTYTFNMFIKLQRPVSHKSPTNYIVREKRGIFFTSYVDANRALILGYRSPYYNIDGDTTYKLKFEPFSFVFSFGVGMIGGMNFTLMTDYKYKFGEMYMLTIKKDANFISIYINGEQQTTASLAFNPCILPTLNNSRGPSRRRHQARMNIAPLAPGFLKKDGTAYSLLDTDWQVYNTGARNHHYLCFGKPLTNSPAFRNNGIGHSLRFKRHLNNLDIGVINAYNIALSQSQISEMYNNFRYRYL